MFDNLLDLVKNNAGDAIVNTPAKPNEQNDAAINTTATSIMDTLKGQMSSGNLTSFMDMFKGVGAEINSTSIGKDVHGNTSGIGGMLKGLFEKKGKQIFKINLHEMKI